MCMTATSFVVFFRPSIYPEQHDTEVPPSHADMLPCFIYSVLDMWIRGDQMTRVALTLGDSINRLSTQQLLFPAALPLLISSPQPGFAVLSQDDQGWLHIQVG